MNNFSGENSISNDRVNKLNMEESIKNIILSMMDNSIKYSVKYKTTSNNKKVSNVINFEIPIPEVHKVNHGSISAYQIKLIPSEVTKEYLLNYPINENTESQIDFVYKKLPVKNVPMGDTVQVDFTNDETNIIMSFEF
ncbi:hypothetical protein [Candidatus Enterococcus murrayae]|uniref:Uncharacterized protein n=1 Tax=Candidatus Enterococcus murrayae TaxID=2815321 RepID=A0ABS3HBC8_9ENTE|nr:hypothetical protein [Enterococcus sp. MJM16]MBO0450772.1 hypothetical protein [Enterococcus sp. MJM16]